MLKFLACHLYDAAWREDDAARDAAFSNTDAIGDRRYDGGGDARLIAP